MSPGQIPSKLCRKPEINFLPHTRPDTYARSRDHQRPRAPELPQALLEDAGIETAVFDGNMSAVQGTLGAVAQRLAVPEDSWEAARRLLIEADLGQWMLPLRVA